MLQSLLHIAGAWGAFGIIAAMMLAFSVLFTLYYSDRRDRETFAMVVTILALALCLSTVALFPVDIFLVSTILDPATGLRREWATNQAIADMQWVVRAVYYVIYGLVTSFCFFWIPLSYFYFEELDEGQSVLRRLLAAFKYTLFFVLVACVLLITGLFMKPNQHENRDLEWLREVLADLDGSGAVAFVAGVLALVGMGVLVFYAAPGLSLLPIHLLGGLKSSAGKVNDINAQLAVNRERQNTIMNRYPPGNNRQITDRDRQAIRELSREELVLENRSRVAQRIRDSWANKLHCVVRPMEIVLGIAGVSLTFLLVSSMAASAIDNLTEEVCGAPCGYILTRPHLPNPLNLIFLKLSPLFPVDYILMLMIIMYMFSATTRGIISIGIRFLWVNMYKFRRAATQPQGLLAGAMLLMLSLSGLSYSLTTTVAPDYSMFGSQKYCNHTIAATKRDCSDYPTLIIPCHIGAPEGLCTPTVTSSLILKIILGTPALGIALYYTQWLFLIVFVAALVFNLIQGCRKGFGVDPVHEDPEDIDDLESRGLLSAIGAISGDRGRRQAERRGLLIPEGGANYGSVRSIGSGTGTPSSR
ncbi:hypothetical protein B0O80DRAFT_494102 [Mortierella sp. GBAus27b]|nr:hypothetical protein BGX31_000373 [Mortierella sp. GBA43]KAI8361557.1 hypothetical protein B0O80DRAFT_494102 [Mortierella sp. GBAus27b]